MKQKVTIIGGGFGGIRAALDLSSDKAFDVTLISTNSDFEYYPGLHKIIGVANHPTYEVPLQGIFKNKPVHVVIARVTDIDPMAKTVVAGGETYASDAVILAIGSQTEYFGIPGLEEQSFGFKSVAEAKRLRAHVQDLFRKHVHSDKAEAVVGLHMVVVGGGPNGVDLAGELASFSRMIAKRYKVSETLMSIDLVEAGPRLLPMLPESIGMRVEQRLRELDVNVMCNRELKEQDSWTIEFADMKIGAKTLVWTAGITTNDLVKNIPGIELVKKNRISVDNYLQVRGVENFYVIGDAADTPFSGLAQTAIYDGAFAARTIIAKSRGKTPRAYIAKPNAFNIGTGHRWSVLKVGDFVMYGFVPYLIRTLIDIKYFLSILPVREVWKLYFK